ncbi:hypothetical protein evm_010142 [Chilo suppressalis]|nr:hypothetical protein evm_010142 [Chilo suppressalis]
MSHVRWLSARSSRLLSSVALRSKGCGILSDSIKTCGIRTMASKVLTLENLNPNIIKLQYAVRGPLVIRAAEIEKELEKGAQKPFKRVIKANIGDAHAMGQSPITFIREVLACVALPELIKTGNFPEDVKKRATELLNGMGGRSAGAYTMSHGVEYIRRQVAAYIERRDGFESRWQDVCLSGGASNAIKNVLQLFCNQVDGKPSVTSSGARWRGWLARSAAIVEVKQLSQWSVIGWVSKNLLSRVPPCFGRHVKPLVPAASAVVSTRQSALGPRGGPSQSLYSINGRPVPQQWGH